MQLQLFSCIIERRSAGGCLQFTSAASSSAPFQTFSSPSCLLISALMVFVGKMSLELLGRWRELETEPRER